MKYINENNLFIFLMVVLVCGLIIPDVNARWDIPTTVVSTDNAYTTQAESTMHPNLEHYVFKFEGNNLSWAFESSCRKEKFSSESCYENCFYMTTVCDWKTIIPGPLLRELIKK